jgi:hypothetical protein
LILYLSDPKLKNLPIGILLYQEKSRKYQKRTFKVTFGKLASIIFFKNLDEPATESYVKDIADTKVEIDLTRI